MMIWGALAVAWIAMTGEVELGHQAFRDGRFEQAEQLLTEALADPDVPNADRGRVLLARIAAASGDGQAMAEHLAEIDALASDDPYVLFWTADLISDRERMRALLERYIEIAPEEQADWVEAARGRLRLDAALGDREIWRRSDAPETITLPLRMSWDDRGRILGFIIEVQLGEKKKPVKLMLDTGSTGLFLVERVAKKHGAEWLSEETAFGGGGDKRHRNRRGILSQLRVGDLRYEEVLVGTTRRELEPYGRYHGLIGIQAFRGYAMQLDLVRQQLLLRRIDEAQESTEQGQPYWMISGQMLVRAAADGAQEGLFLFDTGASWSILGSRYAATIEGTQQQATRDVRGFGGKVEGASIVEGATVRFDGQSSRGEALRAFDLSLRSAVADVTISGFVGLDLMMENRVEIDTMAQRVRLVTAD